MQQWRILETVGEMLSAFRLPRELIIEARGCDGQEGAWYAYGQAVFCYEYVELIQRHSPKVATPGRRRARRRDRRRRARYGAA